MMRVHDECGLADVGTEAIPSSALELGSDLTGSQMSNSDLLNYVSDLIHELEVMAARTGCTTLLGLLDLARSEAMLQQRTQAQQQLGDAGRRTRQPGSSVSA
jgi:hypothetical protein